MALDLNLREGRVRRYIKRLFGDKAFFNDGKIKLTYLKKALNICKDESLRKAIRLAITMKTKWNK